MENLEINVPIYRAKKIDSEEYIVGYLSKGWTGDKEFYYIKTELELISYEIDVTTLAISFEDMLDNQGNKIFASLNKDRKGSDICYSNMYEENLTLKYLGSCLALNTYENNIWVRSNIVSNDLKIIGIQQ